MKLYTAHYRISFSLYIFFSILRFIHFYILYDSIYRW